MATKGAAAARRRAAADSLLNGHAGNLIANQTLEQRNVMVHEIVDIELGIGRILVKNADLDHDGFLKLGG